LKRFSLKNASTFVAEDKLVTDKSLPNKLKTTKKHIANPNKMLDIYNQDMLNRARLGKIAVFFYFIPLNIHAYLTIPP